MDIMFINIISVIISCGIVITTITSIITMTCLPYSTPPLKYLGGCLCRLGREIPISKNWLKGRNMATMYRLSKSYYIYIYIYIYSDYYYCNMCVYIYIYTHTYVIIVSVAITIIITIYIYICLTSRCIYIYIYITSRLFYYTS